MTTMDTALKPRISLRSFEPRPKLRLADDRPPLPPEDRPSVDSIMTRTRPTRDRALERKQKEIEEQMLALAREEEALENRLREARQWEARLRERERTLNEESMLLAMRSHHLDRVQAGDDPAPGNAMPDIASCGKLQAQLREREDYLDARAAELDRREEELEKRAAKSDNGRSAAPGTSSGTGVDEEHEALLREREAFIEQSEELLYNRAQELQELETSLRQVIDELRSQGAELHLTPNLLSDPSL